MGLYFTAGLLRPVCTPNILHHSTLQYHRRGNRNAFRIVSYNVDRKLRREQRTHCGTYKRRNHYRLYRTIINTRVDSSYCNHIPVYGVSRNFGNPRFQIGLLVTIKIQRKSIHLKQRACKINWEPIVFFLTNFYLWYFRCSYKCLKLLSLLRIIVKVFSK